MTNRMSPAFTFWPSLEADFGDAAGNLGPDFGIIHRIDAAGKLGEGVDASGVPVPGRVTGMGRGRSHGGVAAWR